VTRPLSQGIYRFKNAEWSFVIAVAPILAVYSVLLVLPVLLLGRFSFYQKVSGVEGQIILIRDLSFYLRVLKDTLVMALTVTALCTILGYPVAYGLSRAKRWKSTLYVLVLTPFLVSVVIRTYAWMVILSYSGPVNWAMRSLGLINEPVQLIYN
jgi:putative spermidine/putrescine transport system permease protein